jgi:hypothetical protein
MSMTGLPFGGRRRRHPASDYDYRDGDTRVPQVDKWALGAVDQLLTAAWSPDHRQALKAVLDGVFVDLGNSARQGAVAVLDRYLWCYQVLQTRGVEPGRPDFLTLADRAAGMFGELVSAPTDLLVSLVAVPFRGEDEQVTALTIGQRLLVTAAAVAALEAAYGDAVAEEVRTAVTGLDWCTHENGRLVSVDPAAPTAWLDRCRG